MITLTKIVIVFLQMSSTAHPGLAKLLPQMSEVREVGPAVAVPVFPLSDLVPGDLTELFRYSGSLTTPPCSQIVEVRLSEAVRLSEINILFTFYLAVDRHPETGGYHSATDGQI